MDSINGEDEDSSPRISSQQPRYNTLVQSQLVLAFHQPNHREKMVKIDGFHSQ